MILAAPLVIPFAKAVGLSGLAHIGMAALADMLTITFKTIQKSR